MTDKFDLEGDDALAADVAIGALAAAELQAARLRMARDPAFRALVEAWQADLAPMLEIVAPVAPSPAVWAQIEAAITPVQRETVRPTLWTSLLFWRSLAMGGVGIAAVALGLLVARPEGSTQPMLVATLASSDGAALITAAYDPTRGAVILTPTAPERDATHSPELWVIDGDAPPRSLGVIDLANPRAHVIPAERLRGLKPGAILAISIEPLGGSTTGAPTGPVVATGKLTAI